MPNEMMEAGFATPIRHILHLDLDAFFCAVEELENPDLRHRPFAVGGRPEHRGVVASCSYAARALGIHSAMPMSQAVGRCPDLIIVAARHQAYSRLSRQVMAVLHEITDQVEQISIDEAFLEVTGVSQDPGATAQALQSQIARQLRLPCSLGVATNKLVAKIATDVGKAAAAPGHYPNAIRVVAPGQEAAFLAPLPARALWGVGPKTAQRLAELGLETIGDIAAWPAADLIRRFGKHGADLARHAQGIDDRPIVTRHEAKSVSRETTFRRDTRDLELLRDTLDVLAADVGRHLMRRNLYGNTVKLKIRWSDFTTLTRQVTLDQPTASADLITAAANRLLQSVGPENQAVRLIGVGVSGFDHGPRQPTLWDAAAEVERDNRLRDALERLRSRYGADVVRRGVDAADDPEE